MLLHDLDRDGRNDLALARYDQAPPGFQILYGLPGGRFSSPDIYATGSEVLAAGDVDGDLLPDLVVRLASGTQVFRNGGVSGFIPDRMLSNFAAWSATVAELDGDGAGDIVLANLDGASVHFANGAVWRSDSSIGRVINAVAADVDRDGRTDLLFGLNWPAPVVLLANTGSGTFAPPLRINFDIYTVYEVGAADLDKDGDADLVVTGNALRLEHMVDVAVVLHNDGAGGFDLVQEVSLSASGLMYDFLIADADDDGWPDLLFGRERGIELSRNRGDGTFDPARMLVAAYTQALGAEDVDGDGRTDLLATRAAVTGVQILHGLGGGDFPAPAIIDLPGDHVAVADLDRDGRGDIIAVDFENGTVATLRSTGEGFDSPLTFAAPGFPVATPGDIDGDGDIDLVLGRYGYGGTGILLNQGDGTFSPEVRFGDVIGEQVAIADLTGDRVPDLVIFASQQTEGLTVLIGRGGGSFALTERLDRSGESWLLGTGDLDGDGVVDVATAYEDAALGGDIRVRVRRSRGDGTLEPAVDFAIGPALDGPRGLARLDVVGGTFQDLDGDGLADAAVYVNEMEGFSSPWDIGSVFTLRNTGGALGDPVRNRLVGNGRSLATGSVSGGGRRDVVLVDSGGYGLSMLAGMGGGALAPFRRWALPLPAWSLALGDLDGDLRDEVVAGSPAGIAVFRGACLPAAPSDPTNGK